MDSALLKMTEANCLYSLKKCSYMESEKKSLAQLIAEEARSQCKGCDGKGWTVSIDKHISYHTCPKCSGRGKTYAS